MRDSESRMKDMYKEVSMQQQGYCLHTMMVNKGIPALQVKSSYTLLIDDVCTLHILLYSLSGVHSIDKSMLYRITLNIQLEVMIP